jgi:phosphoglycolate phosphatase-like HAD superfamily hydrolase
MPCSFITERSRSFNDGISKLIYASAFQSLAGRPPSTAAPTEGRTDRAIMRAYFETEGLDPLPWSAAQAALMEAGMAHRASLARSGSVLPGVQEFLEKVATDCRIVQSVLTGNIRPNTELRLSAFGLDRLLELEVGAYGADAEQCPDLVPIAVARFKALRGELPSAVLLIGDTPRDVEAANEAGASILAVATGLHKAADLESAGASIVFDNLADIEAVLTVIGAFV